MSVLRVFIGKIRLELKGDAWTVLLALLMLVLVPVVLGYGATVLTSPSHSLHQVEQKIS